MKPPLSYVPLLPVLLSLAAGVLLYNLTDSVVIPILYGVCATAGLFCHKRYIATLACTVAVGWCVALLNNPASIPEYCKQSGVRYIAVAREGFDTAAGYEIRGTLHARISPDDGSVQEVTPTPVTLSVRGFNGTICRGDTIIFKGNYFETKHRPDLPDEFNPANTGNPGIARFSVSYNDLTQGGNSGGFLNTLQKIRGKMAEAIITCGTDEACSNFLLASLLGDGRWISHDERELYSRTGMAHILALSGAHVGLILGMLTLALAPLSSGRLRIVRNVIIIVLLWCYVAMTGGTASVLRAVIMVTMVLIGVMIRRPHGKMNSLCGAAILILLFTPTALFQPGFQLSFMAVASIILLSERLNPASDTKYYNLVKRLLLPVAATLGTFALVIYYFHIFPPYFIVVSPVATVLLTIVMTCGIVLILTTLTGVPHTFLADTTSTFFDIAHRYLGIADTLPESAIEKIYISLPTVIVLSLLPFIIAAFIHYRRKWIVGAWVGATAICIISEFTLFNRYPEREIFILDQPYNLCIAAKNGHEMVLVTTADRFQSPQVVEKFGHGHQDYVSKRHITGLHLLEDSTTIMGCTRRGNAVMMNGVTIMLLNNNTCPDSLLPHPIDYLVVTDGFRGEILKAVRKMNPGNIVIAHDLNHKLRKRYARQLRGAGYEPIDLSAEGTLRIAN